MIDSPIYQAANLSETGELDLPEGLGLTLRDMPWW